MSNTKPNTPGSARSRKPPVTPKQPSVIEAVAPKPEAPATKLSVIVALASRPEGARIDEMMAATGWQAHSVRGALSGGVKKQLKLTVRSEKTEAGRVYRVIPESQP